MNTVGVKRASLFEDPNRKLGLSSCADRRTEKGSSLVPQRPVDVLIQVGENRMLWPPENKD